MKEYLYILVHEHKYGHSDYPFLHKDKDLHLEPIQARLINLFAIEYEPEKGEFLELNNHGPVTGLENLV